MSPDAQAAKEKWDFLFNEHQKLKEKMSLDDWQLLGSAFGKFNQALAARRAPVSSSSSSEEPSYEEPPKRENKL